MKRPIIFAAVSVSLTFFAMTWSQALANEFYQGKTIRFIVGFSAGGGYDTYTRTIARHIPKHIPGNPSTTVENMTGAGSTLPRITYTTKPNPMGSRWEFLTHTTCSTMPWGTQASGSTAERSVGSAPRAKTR